ncbi:MAG: hypothetical protein HS117_01810 [Verrucomicrobiaceae bacterium]|nr:hypothetical protein [Verrucomicrobiaceae bacterium]
MTEDEFSQLSTTEKANLPEDKLKMLTQAQVRKVAEAIAAIDSDKPFEQLLTDIHDELLQKRSKDDNQLHANKRLASLTARAANESDKTAKLALRVSYMALAASVAACVLAIVQILVALIDLCKG